MSYATRRAERRHAREPQSDVPDSLKDPDGQAIPVWDAEASDPIAYLASVIDLLPGARAVETAGVD